MEFERKDKSFMKRSSLCDTPSENSFVLGKKSINITQAFNVT